MSQPQSSQIPDLIKIGSIPTDTAINVETSILDPVIFSENEARFVLEQKGILHSNSRITFSTDGGAGVAAATGGRSFYPPGIGVHSLIQRCALRVGTKTICEIEDFNQFMNYESTFIPPDAIKEREQVLSGRFVSTAPVLQAGAWCFKNASNNASLSQSLTESESIQLDNGKNVNSNGALKDQADPVENTVGAGDESVTAALNTRLIWDFQSEENKPTFSVLLADLFPFLKMNQLPLYMMSEPVSIHLTFEAQQSTPADSRRIVSTFGVSPQAEVSLVRGDCQLIADYIYYPQEMMEAYRTANRNMTFNYVDYQNVSRTVSIAQYSSGLILNLGGAGRIVNKVMMGAGVANGYTGGLLNKYNAVRPAPNADTTGLITTNLKYNDNFLYPVDVTNDARHYHNVFSTEGRVPYISRDMYSGEGQLATSSLNTPGAIMFEAYEASDELGAMSFWTAYRLNKGERVNSRGIEVYDTRLTMAASTTLRVWLQVVRVAVLRDGVMTVSYA